MCGETLSELDGEIAISEKHKKSSGLFWKDRHSVTELEFRPGSYFSSIKAFQEKGGLTWPLGRVRQWGCWLKSVCSAVTTNLQILLSRRWHKLASTCSPEHPAPKQRWHLYGTWHCRAEEPEPGQGQLEQQPGRDTRRCSLLAARPSWAVQCLSSGPPLCRGNFTALTQYWASSTWLTWSDTV